MNSIHDVLADTQRLYRRRVYRSWVHDYLASRHLVTAIPAAAIGHAPAGWLTTTDHLLSLGHRLDDIVHAGVAVADDRGIHDVMREAPQV